MRNQIVSQDELREEGGSPTHALFALEMLLCRGGWGDCYVHHESTLRLFFCMFYDLAAGDPLAHREERGRRYGLLLMFGNLGELLLERHTAHIKMKYLWSDIQYAIVLLFMNWTELVGQALREQARTAQQDCGRMDLNPCDSGFHNFFLLQPFRFEFLYRFELKGQVAFPGGTQGCRGGGAGSVSASHWPAKGQRGCRTDSPQWAVKRPEEIVKLGQDRELKLADMAESLGQVFSFNTLRWRKAIYIYIHKENHVQMVDMWFFQAEAPGSRCEEPSWGEDALKT